MRHALPTFALSLAVAFGSSLFVPHAVLAQDEFDDEFDEPAAAPAASNDGFDEFDEPAAAPANSGTQDDLADVEADMGDDTMSDHAMDDETPSQDEAASEDEAAHRARLFREHASLLGPIGGVHTVSAGSAATKSFRMGLMTDFFASNGFIGASDHASHVGGTLALSWSVHDNVEIFASILSYANSNDLGDPSLLQVLGDTHLGLKAFTWVTPVISIGGDLDLAFLNSVGDIGLLFKGTSVGLRANFTADLRGRSNPFPFIFRFNAQYQFDNSNKLVRGVENRRYDSLGSDADPIRANETRNLLTTVERFGLGINRVDHFNFAMGFEFPIRASEDFYVSPMLEWTWGIPVNRQDYNCLVLDVPGGDGCLDKVGPSSFPMDLTLGVRVLPPVEGLSILAAADIGLTGQNDFVRELAPNMPYDIILGFAYAYDTQPRGSAQPEIHEVVRRVEVPIPPPVQGRVHGIVVEQGANTPISGATIAFAGRDLTSLITGDDGTFTTYMLEPGEVRFDISHPEYNSGACVATIPSERPGAAPAAAAAPAGAAPAAGSMDDEFGDAFDEPSPEPTAVAATASAETAPTDYPEIVVEVRCELTALPRVGSVDGRVLGDEGNGVVGATVQLSGPSSQNATSNSNGRFQASNLPPGTYTARVEAEGFLIKLQQFEVQAREVAAPEITLVPQPRHPLVRVSRRSLSIRRQINFATDSDEILPSSDGLMSEIADVLIRNPQLQLVEIQGHTDNRGPRAHNMELSQRRADSVRTWLSTHGVEGSRLEAHGYGPDTPLVPNITPANRARNRRVQFIIKTQGDSE